MTVAFTAGVIRTSSRARSDVEEAIGRERRRIADVSAASPVPAQAARGAHISGQGGSQSLKLGNPTAPDALAMLQAEAGVRRLKNSAAYAFSFSKSAKSCHASKSFNTRP